MKKKYKMVTIFKICQIYWNPYFLIAIPTCLYQAPMCCSGEMLCVSNTMKLLAVWTFYCNLALRIATTTYIFQHQYLLQHFLIRIASNIPIQLLIVLNSVPETFGVYHIIFIFSIYAIQMWIIPYCHTNDWVTLYPACFITGHLL